MVCGNDVVDSICAGRKLSYEEINLLDRFLTGIEYLILSRGMVASGVDLVVINVHDILSGEHVTKRRNIH